MEWLSKGVEQLVRLRGIRRGAEPRDAHFDAIVVGSGYGGSVAASRLARAGFRVCVLERGREYVPGEFPNDLSNLPAHVRVDRADSPTPAGRADALFDIRIGRKMMVLVGNALGGTSQINASVAIRADPAVFRQDAWPDPLRLAQDPLDAWYTLAEEMLGVSPVPEGQLPPKYRQLEALLPHVRKRVHCGTAWSKDFAPEVRCYPARLAVTFGDFRDAEAARGEVPRRRNRFGVEQSPCVGCGDCVTGCNYWAKNTLTMNYLPDAVRNGAELYTGASVVAVRPRTVSGVDGTTVYFRSTGEGPPAMEEDEALRRCYELHASVVVLAGGPLGTVEILMRSQALQFLRVSPRLGKGFSGNGDALAFGFDQDAAVHAVGWGRNSRDPIRGVRQPVGPTITGVIDARAGVPVREGRLLEDGIVPGAIARLVHEALATTGTLAQMTECRFKRDGRAHEADPLALEPGALERTQTYLMMGHDDASGELIWKDGRVIVRWPQERPLDAVERGYALAECARELGAIPLRNPLHQPLPPRTAAFLGGPSLDGPAITVHPLGGCAMGNDFQSSVVNHAGAVFNGRQPHTAHRGLYVMDGSVMPTALGVNPLLTITALAERNAALLIERLQRAPRKRFADYSLPQPRPGCAAPPPPALERPRVPRPDQRGAPEAIRVRLGETMRGWLGAPGVSAPPEAVADPMAHANASLELKFTVGNVDEFLRDPRHAIGTRAPAGGAITGSLRIPHLHRDPFVVQAGRVEILSRLPSGILRRMRRALCHWLRQRGFDEARRLWNGVWRRRPPGTLFSQPREWSAYLRRELRNVVRYVFAIPLVLRIAKHAGEARQMPYRLTLIHPATGARWELEGAKRVAFEPGRNVWSSLGHLQDVRLRDDSGRVAARGELHLDMIELTERRAAQLESRTELPNALAAFAGYPLLFLRVIMKTHLWDFRAPDYAGAARPRQLFIESLAGVPPEARSQYWFCVPEWERANEVRDRDRGRIPLALTRFCLPEARASGNRRPVLLLHGFAQSSLAFGPDLPEADGAPTRGDECLAKFLYDAGFDLWLLDYRHSIALESARSRYDLDLVALVDLPCAVDFILAQLRSERGLPADANLQLAAFGHCMGGATLAMALLSGRLAYAAHESKIEKAVISQVPPFIVGGEYSQWRRELAAFLRDWLKLDAVDLAAVDAATPIEAVADRLLATLPAEQGERCPHEFERAEPRTDIATCKRVSGIIGPLFRHRNLREGTHRQLNRYFGLGNIEVFAQIGKFFDYERLVTSDGDNAYLTEENVLDHFDLPVLFVHGEKNRTFSWRSTTRTIERLERINGKGLYVPLLVPDTGHFDCIVGENARRAVFEKAADFLRAEAPSREPAVLECLVARPPLLGPVLGWTRQRDGTPIVRLWVKVDENDTQPAMFLLTAVRAKGGGAILQDFVQAWPVLVSESGFGPPPDSCGGMAREPRRELNAEHRDVKRLRRTVALADVRLPDSTNAYEIVAVTVHRAARGEVDETRMLPLEIRGLASASVGDLLAFSEEQEKAQSRRPAYRRRYAEARERMRDEGWLLRAARDPLDWFEPGSAPARAELAELLIAWLDEHLGRRRARRERPQRELSRVTRHAPGFEECVAAVPPAALAPGGDGIALRFLAGSCRYPGLDLDRDRSGTSLELACDAAREANAPGASFMLMVGDQIYADYTGGAFDTQSAVEKYGDGYAVAYRSPGFRRLARNLPHYMAIDDHEIDNDWSLDRIRRSPEPGDALRQVRCAIASYDAFQSVHGPGLALPWRLVTATTPAERVPFRGFATSFSAGGACFFIMDTRTQRHRGDAPQASRIAGSQQLGALDDWLRASPRDAAKFIVSGSVFFPGIDELDRDGGAYRARGDTWQAFPEDQKAVLDLLASHRSRHVVFLSGDYHCAAIAQGRLELRGRTVVERVTGIVVPPFYAPLPFANAHPDSVMRLGCIGEPARAQLRYADVQAFAGWAGFADLRLRRDAADAWQLDVHYRYEDGRVESRTVTL